MPDPEGNSDDVSRLVRLWWWLLGGVAFALLVVSVSESSVLKGDAARATAERIRRKVSPRRDKEVLEGLLEISEWKTDALRLVDMEKARARTGLRTPTARTAARAPLLPEIVSMRSIELELQGDFKPEGPCTLSAGGSGGFTRAVARRPLRFGGWFPDTKDVEFVLSCPHKGFLGGWSVQSDSATLSLENPSNPLVLSPGGAIVSFAVRGFVPGPDDDTGTDGTPAGALRLTAPAAASKIAPSTGNVSYRELDATDYVRVNPGGRLTSALLCSSRSIVTRVRATRVDSGEQIGAFVLDGKCLAVAVDAWDGILFQVTAVGPWDGFQYEVASLSSSGSPDLPLVGWYAAERIVHDGKFTGRETRAQVKELLDAFGIEFLEKGFDKATATQIGDPTAASYLAALAEIAKEPP